MRLFRDRMALFAWGYSKNKDYSAKSVDFAFAKSQEAANSSWNIEYSIWNGVFPWQNGLFLSWKEVFPWQNGSFRMRLFQKQRLFGEKCRFCSRKISRSSKFIWNIEYSISNGVFTWQNEVILSENGHIPSKNGVFPWQNVLILSVNEVIPSRMRFFHDIMCSFRMSLFQKQRLSGENRVCDWALATE